LNYGRALENLPDDKILARLKDWNCEWLARPNIAISEMASTLKDNMDTILAYRGTVFTEDFIDQLQGFLTPMMGPLQRLDNKDRSTNDPPTQDDILDVLEGINGNDQVEHLFIDAFNACGPVLMMVIHVMAINTLLHNPPGFPNQTLRCTATEEFKANPSDDNMMKYLLDSILMRRRSVQRTRSLWDRSRYQRDGEEEASERPSRNAQRLDHREGKSGGRRSLFEQTALLASCAFSYASSALKHCHPGGCLRHRSLPCVWLLFQQEEEGEQFPALRRWGCSKAPLRQCRLPHVFLGEVAHGGVPLGAVTGELGARLLAFPRGPPR